MVTVMHGLMATDSMKLPSIDLRQRANLPEDAGFSGWAQAVQLRLANLLASDASADVADESQAEASESPAENAAETARLEGVQLAAREIAHLVNNDLAVTVGMLDLLRRRGELPASAVDMLNWALAGANAAAHHVAQLQQVQRVVTRDTPAGPALDLERSV